MLRATIVPLALLLTLLWIGAPQAGMKSANTLSVGQQAPGFSFANLATGEVGDLHGLAEGKPLLVVFLQTACRSCIREMIALKRIQQEGFEVGVLGVFVDLRDRGFQEYIRDYELSFPFTWDANFTVAEAYGIG